MNYYKILFLILIFSKDNTYMLCRSAILEGHTDNVPINNNEISEDFTVWNSNIESEYKDRGQAYLINFTAAWCITCIVNEKNVLSDNEVLESFKNNGVTYLKADWTKRSKKISKTICKTIKRTI